MRRYWTGTTDQSRPRDAPAVWPMPFHQSIAEMDRDEARNERGRVALVRLQTKPI
jgi:hypothetical protein